MTNENKWYDPEVMFKSIEKPETKEKKYLLFKVLERGTLIQTDEYAIAYEICEMNNKELLYPYSLNFCFSTPDGFACSVLQLYEINDTLDRARETIKEYRLNYLEVIEQETLSYITMHKIKTNDNKHLFPSAIKDLIKTYPVIYTLFPDLYNKEIIPLIAQTYLNK